ncbi:MAG: hypothetical protein DHS20C01_18000 [marine bacterium B5-7]|nr:MAG: hypothetical protein DHS20C01_18000 [marine bacterium B5-7]
MITCVHPEPSRLMDSYRHAHPDFSLNTVQPDQAASKPHRGDFLSIIFAGAMSLILPGYGQLYNADPGRAAWIFLIFCTASISAIALVSLLVPDKWLIACFVLSIAITLLTWFISIVDALWQAWRHPVAERPWQTTPLYIAVLLIAYLLVFKAGGGYIRSNLIESFRIPSQSMAPGILRGDFLFADKRVNCPGCSRSLQPGDVALFIYPDNRNLVFIKRVIGMPGDRIEIEGTDVKRNGKSLSVITTPRSGGRIEVVERGARGVYEVEWSRPVIDKLTFKVPHGHVFVMGDNRNHSQDSRVIGPVALADVIGIARQIWLSVDDSLDIRWGRMGKTIH